MKIRETSFIAGTLLLWASGASAFQISHHRPFVKPRTIHSSSRLANVISSNEDLLPGIEAINQANGELFAKLEEMREQPYFRLYSVDILGSCEYMPQELFECYSSSCEIYPVDEDEVSSAVLLTAFVIAVV